MLSVCGKRVLVVIIAALTASGCANVAQQAASANSPRGATVAFDSIDGPPPAQFHRLVQDLNDEAQVRRLAVMSREKPSSYRVRGYISAKVEKGRTTIAYLWDVYDGSEQRALRISGEEVAKERHRNAWIAADDAMLRKIAKSSMDQLAAFLTSPDVAPATPAENGFTLASSSPEAAGIYRMFQANADPVSGDGVSPEAAPDAAISPDEIDVPLPRRRPSMVSAANEAAPGTSSN